MVASKKKPYPVKSQLINAQKVYVLLINIYGLPTWHHPLTALDELISTILSQNTNDRNRDAAYHNLRSVFPVWEQVMNAPINEVIAAIRSAGLANQKGPRIQAILRQISDECGSLNLSFLEELPPQKARQWLLRFKGVGPKTAAIVMQFSLHHPAFPVDTHIYRVSGRIGLRPSNMSVEQTHQFMEKLFIPDQYALAHLNLIRLGREICQAHKPKCPQCPVNRQCDYFKNAYSTNQ